MFFQFTATRREKMNETRISSRPIGKLHAIRTFAEQFSVIRRLVDDRNGHRGLYPKFLRQWCARITGHSELLYRSSRHLQDWRHKATSEQITDWGAHAAGVHRSVASEVRSGVPSKRSGPPNARQRRALPRNYANRLPVMRCRRKVDDACSFEFYLAHFAFVSLSSQSLRYSGGSG